MGKEPIRAGLGALESKVLSELAAEGKTVFSLDELAEKTVSRGMARKLASDLVRKKWLERLGRGTYLILELAAGSQPAWTEDSFFIASKLAKPYYIGYLSMLNFYGWTEQIPVTVTVATTKTTRRKKIHGINYEFVVLAGKKFFGYREIYLRGHKVNVSDQEKTLVDSLDHPEYAGGILEVAKAIANADVDWNKVIAYASRMENGAIFKRLGFLLEQMNVSLPTETIETIQKKLTKGYAPLYPGLKSKGKYNARWNLLINTQFSKEKVMA